MIDNALRDEICELMAKKGFHDKPIAQPDAHLWKQLCHVIIELKEAIVCTDDELGEELADIAYVILDLMGVRDIPILKTDIDLLDCNEWYELVPEFVVYAGRLMDYYRKKNDENKAGLWNQMLATVEGMAFLAGVDLEDQLRRKHNKNADRQPLYGVAQ